MKIEKAVEIFDAEIQFVSLVDKAANGRRFLITKNKNKDAAASSVYGEGASFSRYGRILKVDNETHYLTGVVYEPFTADAHGNFMSAEEIRKAAWRFAKDSDKVDVQHSFSAAPGISVVESYIAPCDMRIGEQLIAKGTWLMSVEVCNDEVWEQVRKGVITGFSMGGFGRYAVEDVPERELEALRSAEKGGLFKRLAAALRYESESENEAKEVEDMTIGRSLLTREEVQVMIDESLEAFAETFFKAGRVAKNLNDERGRETENAQKSIWNGII
jgi:hypothetical protein